ncbi:MAG TPA: hypothetical protein VFC77_12730 [Myxococcota bacterium]|nr:hypothetical protein [Myxococcota bacterium]
MHKQWMLSSAAIAALVAGPAGAASVQARFGVPAAVEFSAVSDQCQNNPGPFITLSGDLTLGGIGGRLIFRNNAQGTHERVEEVKTGVTLLAAGETIHFAKQPPQGGVGGNPYIWVQFYDGAWKSVSTPILLGRCVQGLRGGAALFKQVANAALEIEASGSCTNHPGPEISLEGGIVLGGLNAKLVFTNNAKWTHVAKSDVVVDLVILPAGQGIEFPKQPPLGGVGGNPLIYFQFVDESGAALSPEISLGRCVQLSK